MKIIAEKDGSITIDGQGDTLLAEGAAFYVEGRTDGVTSFSIEGFRMVVTDYPQGHGWRTRLNIALWALGLRKPYRDGSYMIGTQKGSDLTQTITEL